MWHANDPQAQGDRETNTRERNIEPTFPLVPLLSYTAHLEIYKHQEKVVLS